MNSRHALDISRFRGSSAPPWTVKPPSNARFLIRGFVGLRISEFRIILLVLFIFHIQSSALFAQSTAFTYQGRLNDGAGAANGSYDLRFALYDNATDGAQQGLTITNSATAVSNGLFTLTLDFGNQFPGASRWLEIAARTNGGGSFATLSPRQALRPAPYAIFAENVNASGIAGSIADNQLSSNIARLNASQNFTGAVSASKFAGNGAGLTNLSLASIVMPTDTHVVGWGANNVGQATVPAGLTGVSAVAAGAFHSVALKSNGSITAWGSNGSGVTNVPATLSNATAVAAGQGFTIALKNNGTVVAWGANAFGQTNVPGGLDNVTAISAGGDHSLALRNDGTVVSWGYNGYGATNVPAGLSNVLAVAAGGSYSLALRNDGTVVAWGDNSFGQTNVPLGLTNVIAVAAGGEHSLALKNDGTVVGWGTNNYNQLSIPPGLTNVTSIAAGAFHSVALNKDGSVVVWGYNSFGLTTVPLGLNNVLALAPGCTAYHVLVVQALVSSPALLVNGTLPDSSLSTNVALLKANQTFIGQNTFNGPSVFNGTSVFNALMAGPTSFNGDVGIGINSPQQLLQLNVTPGHGEGMEIDSGISGYSPAIYLNNTATGGHNFRIASYGDGLNPGKFVIRDDTLGADPFTIDSAGVLIGNGNGLTNLDAANLATGTLPDARLSSNVPRLHVGSQSFSGNISFLNGRIGIGTSSTTQLLHLNVIPGGGRGMEIDSTNAGYSPAILLYHAGGLGYAYSISSYSDNLNPGKFVIRDEISGSDPFTIDSAGVLVGNGNGLTNFDAANLATGTLPDARLSSNVPRLNAAQTFSGANTFLSQSAFAGLTIFTNANVGIGTNSPQQLLHLNVALGHGDGMEIDSANPGHTPAIYLNHTANAGHNFRVASFGDSTDVSFRIRDDTIGLDRLIIEANGNVGIGNGFVPTNKLHVLGGVSATAFVNTSDRNAKENFKPISTQEVLTKLTALPITAWTFKEMKDGPHLGPVAQDFYAAFGLGGSDKTITLSDEAGVALAAIQGLNEKVEQKDAEITELKRELADLKMLVKGMNEKIARGTE